MINRILLFLLAFSSRCIIARHRPYIIGVTGTVGKTTITSHVATYLSILFGRENVKSSEYHYNGEYGLPLTIIGARTGEKNIFRWILVFGQAFITYIRPYPKYLVLEYGIDHPGEMEYLLSIVHPDISILSPVAPNHLEQFGNFENYKKAKYAFIEQAKGKCIIHDSHKAIFQKKDAIFFGENTVSDIHFFQALQKPGGIEAKIIAFSDSYKIFLPAFGLYQIENILPIYALGYLLQADIHSIAANAGLFAPESGRSRILSGQSNSIIIDGSYNGGFESMMKGVDSVLPFLETHRIIFFLGDMRELGEHSKEIHTTFAHHIVESIIGDSVDILFVLIGKEMRTYVEPILSKKFSVLSELSSKLGGEIIRVSLENETKPTIIYVKGSQNTIFLEEGIKYFLEDNEDESLLPRQSVSWLRRKEKYFQSVIEKDV